MDVKCCVNQGQAILVRELEDEDSPEENMGLNQSDRQSKWKAISLTAAMLLLGLVIYVVSDPCKMPLGRKCLKMLQISIEFNRIQSNSMDFQFQFKCETQEHLPRLWACGGDSARGSLQESEVRAAAKQFPSNKEKSEDVQCFQCFSYFSARSLNVFKIFKHL